jgi:O-antigen/teichoic acid export membrane protein
VRQTEFAGRLPRSMDLKRRTLDGLAWTFLARLVLQIVQYVISIVIARLLIPDDFGMVAMVGVFTGIAGIFVDFGIGAAIVQHRDLTDEQSRAAFGATVALGLVLSLLTFLCAPLIGAFYGRPELLGITRAMALVFVLNAIGIVPKAILQRGLRLRRLAFNDVTATIFGAVLNLVLALRGAHVWSLVIASLCSSAIGAALACGATKTLRPSLHWNLIEPLLKVGANLLGFNFVNYWARNADNLIIGKMLGERELGVYVRAYSLMMLAMSQVAATVSSGMIPALALVKEDRPRTQRMYLRALGMTAFVSFPLMVGLCASADTFMRTVYGAKWLDAIPILRVLALVGALQAVLNPVGWIFVSQGRTDRMFRIGTLTALVIVVGFAVGATFHSAQAVAWSYFVTNLIICLPEMKVAGDCIGLGLGQMLGILRKSTASAVLMGVVVWGIGRVAAGCPSGATLAIQIVSGAAVYFGTAWLSKEPALIDAREMVGERWRRLKQKLRPTVPPR